MTGPVTKPATGPATGDLKCPLSKYSNPLLSDAYCIPTLFMLHILLLLNKNCFFFYMEPFLNVLIELQEKKTGNKFISLLKYSECVA
jgi:hypothetical protein